MKEFENPKVAICFVAFGLSFLLLGIFAGKLLFFGGVNYLKQSGSCIFLESCD